MKPLTNKMIEENLNNAVKTDKLIFFSVCGLMLFFLIKIFIDYKMGKTTKTRGNLIFYVAIAAVFFTILIKGFIVSSATQNSIKNNSYEVVTDVIVDKYYNTTEDDEYYYIYLKNYGRIEVSSYTYYRCREGKSVYVVVVEGKNGEKYRVGRIYLTDEYEYVND